MRVTVKKAGLVYLMRDSGEHRGPEQERNSDVRGDASELMFHRSGRDDILTFQLSNSHR
jgi:hypothetical protein